MRDNLVSDVKNVAGGDDAYATMMQWASRQSS